MRSTSLNVAHVLNPAPFGGLETVVLSLASGQHARGEGVLVVPVVPAPVDEHPFVQQLDALGIPFVALESRGRRYGTESRDIQRVLSDFGADIAHSHGYRADFTAGGAARRLGIPAASTVHGFTRKGWKGRFYERVQLWVLRRHDVVVAVSNPLRAELEAAGVPEGRIRLIPNGWAPAGDLFDRTAARARLGIANDAPRVGWVGRMSEEKSPETVVRALALSEGGWEVSFIGDGPLMPGLRELAVDLGVDGRCQFHGVVPDAARLLPAFDAMVLSSTTEGTPMVLLEAMAAEVPIVATSVGGVPDLLAGGCGRLVQSGDANELADAVDDVIRSGAKPEVSRALRRIETVYSLDGWVKNHRKAYRSVISGE